MDFSKIILPYQKSDLEPVISTRTMDFHFDKHYTTYLSNTNNIKKDTQYEHMSIDEIIQKSSGSLYNNAAQTSNHELFFLQFSKYPKKEITGDFLIDINNTFGSLEEFKNIINEVAITHFGSGWSWLVLDNDGAFKIISKENGYSPITNYMFPLLAIDIWEHAYYLDYQNKRGDFVKSLWQIIDWEVIQQRYVAAKKRLERISCRSL